VQLEGVVLFSVIHDFHTGLSEFPELLPIEIFIPEAVMEALH